MKQQDFLIDPILLNYYDSYIKLICDHCSKPFSRKKSHIIRSLEDAKNNSTIATFCSQTCRGKHIGEAIIKPCAQCSKDVRRTPKELKKNKSNNFFCCSSCAAIYNNTHKQTGNRRSKLEIWLEEQIKITYPNLEIIYNGKNTINSELDFYMPSLNLAFELNGIFHYEPIYGKDKLDKIQSNDDRKIQACLEKNIELCIIDSSSMKRFTEGVAKQYLEIFTTIINKKLGEL